MGFTPESARRAINKRHATTKSNDAKKADAAAAREVSRMNRSPEPLEAIVDQVQDAVAKKEEAGASEEVVQLAKTSLDALLKNIELLTTRLSAVETRKVIEPETGVPAHAKCSSCGQSLRVCKGEHTTVWVAPKDQDMWKFFSGINWNGVKYAGRCVLATSTVDAILSQISQWEQQERRRFIPGGKVFGDLDLKYAMQGRTAII